MGLALARQLTIHGRLDESLPLIREYLPVLEATGSALDPMHVTEGRMALGEVLLEQGRLHEAVPALETALAALRSTGAPIPLTVGALLLARAWAEVGRYDEALALLHGTLQRRLDLWGAEHSSTALVMQRIGSVHLYALRLDEAENWLRRVGASGDVREHVFGSVKHRETTTLLQVGLERGQFEHVLGQAAEVRRVMLALPPEQRTPALRITTELVWLRALLGLGPAQARPADLEAAEATLAALAAICAPLYEGAPLRLAVQAVRTRWLALAGRLEAARSALAEAEAGFALQPLGAQFTRLLEEARSALR